MSWQASSFQILLSSAGSSTIFTAVLLSGANCRAAPAQTTICGPAGLWDIPLTLTTWQLGHPQLLDVHKPITAWHQNHATTLESYYQWICFVTMTPALQNASLFLYSKSFFLQKKPPKIQHKPHPQKNQKRTRFVFTHSITWTASGQQINTKVKSMSSLVQRL